MLPAAKSFTRPELTLAAVATALPFRIPPAEKMKASSPAFATPSVSIERLPVISDK